MSLAPNRLAMERKTKLEEQATGKAELSYSYWAANAAGDAPPPQPKKLSEEEAAEQAQRLTHVASGASAWNAAGTWEERPVPLSWVQEQLGLVLAEVAHRHQGAEVAVVEVTSCSGEAHQWLVRGKKRAGFELSIEFKWRAKLAGAGSSVTAVTGTAKLPHAAADELDELKLEGVKADAAAVATSAPVPAGGAAESDADVKAAAPTVEQRGQAEAAVGSMLPALEEALGRMLERMKQR